VFEVNLISINIISVHRLEFTMDAAIFDLSCAVTSSKSVFVWTLWRNLIPSLTVLTTRLHFYQVLPKTILETKKTPDVSIYTEDR